MFHRFPHPRQLATLAATLALGVLAAGCGSGGSSQTRSTTGGTDHARPSASLVLDFTPNAIHSGIYLALARDYDRQAGVSLHVVVPGQSTDAVQLLETGRVQFAILDIHDLAIADQHAAKLVGVMAVVQRPLASVIAAPRFATPRQLIGQTVGVTGDPSDLAVLRSVLAGAGVAAGKVHTLTIGYDAVADLLAGRVAAATAFWNDEGVELARRASGYHVFRVEQFGAPSYPELVLCTTRALGQRSPRLVRSVVQALQRGYAATITDPTAAVQALLAGADGLDKADVVAQLKAEIPAFTPPAGAPIGGFSASTLRAWARWEARFGIVSKPPDVAALFDASFLDQSIR